MVFILSSSNGKKLSDLLGELPERYIIKDKITSRDGPKILKSLISAFSEDTIDQTDGVKIFRDHSWALIRASGTEPIIRIIIDSENMQQGQALYCELKDKINLNTKY